jgi:hypothetical protein
MSSKMFEPRIVSGLPNREKFPWRGVFYLLTFVSVPQFVLYALVRDPYYIVGPGPDTGVIVGGILEIIVALTWNTNACLKTGWYSLNPRI